MNFDDLTLGQLREIKNMCGVESKALQPYKIGQAYLIRCVTNYAIGFVVAVGEQEIVLREGGWAADTGRFNEALSTGVLSEFEPNDGDYEWLVGRGSVVDARPWNHDMPHKVIG